VDSTANLPAVQIPKPPADLKRWHRRYAQWLAQQFGKRVSQDEEMAMAAKLAGKPVAWSQIRSLKRNPLWREAFEASLDDFTDKALKKSRVRATHTAARGIKVLDLSVRRVQSILKDKSITAADHLNAIRAVTPILNTLTERVWPKKEEREVNQNIRITLTTHQEQRLEAPPMPIEAVDVPYEVIAVEQPQDAA
jgi:hypothetical protein